MKKLLLFLLGVGIATFLYFKFFKTDPKSANNEAPKPVAIISVKHSATFNATVDSAITQYLNIKNALIDADTSLAKLSTKNFIAILDSIPLAELDKDSLEMSTTAKASIEDIKSNALSLIAQTDITEIRQDFNMLTNMMYPAFFKSINYEGRQLYIAHCPMAFNGDQGADWLSNSSEVVNPYLGKNHPKYKAAMLNCGEVKDSVLSEK